MVSDEELNPTDVYTTDEERGGLTDRDVMTTDDDEDEDDLKMELSDDRFHSKTLTMTTMSVDEMKINNFALQVSAYFFYSIFLFHG